MPATEGIWGPATQQRIFRRLMTAMARPGDVQDLTDLLGDASAARAVLATLLDKEVGLADPHGLLAEEDWPLLHTERVQVEGADYLLCDGSRLLRLRPRLGTLESPELSATLILRVTSLDRGRILVTAKGPGIAGVRELRLEGLDSGWIEMRKDWTCAFPLGVDLILVDESRVTAVPRTTQLEVKAWAM